MSRAILKSLPGAPLLAKVSDVGAIGVNRSVVPSTTLSRSDSATVIRTGWLLDPATFMIAGLAAPEHTTLPVQVRTPAWLRVTVLVPVAPDRAIVPKSRSCLVVRLSDFTTLA